MSTNKNKFNTSKNTKGWFPFAKFLFITDNHPIRQSKDKCSSSIEALFSQQELEQINGITNSLQCETKDAIRIALYETCKDAHTAYEKTYIKAKSASTVKGHEGRKTEKRLTLPLSEKQAALDAAKQLNITIKEFLRLAVIWIADGIKEESITSLTNSKRIGKDAVAKQWSRDNRDKPPSESVKKLKEAQKDAEALADYYHDLKKAKEAELPSTGNYYADKLFQYLVKAEEALVSAEKHSWESELLNEVDDMDDLSFLARCKMREYGVDFKTAKQFVEDELNEATMFDKMTSKEKLQFLKKKHAPTKEEILLAERRKQHEIKLQKWSDDYQAYLESFPKTWRGYVQNARVEKLLLGNKEPFPEIPDPIPDDYPMPDGWDESKVYWEIPRKDAKD